MHIGLDFDNTIVSYDDLFHKVALEGGWIDDSVPISKVSVRDHLRQIGKESVWTEMQGYVYGARMGEASCYPGVIHCLSWARDNSIPVSIVSHKTLYPFAGKQYDLHKAARHWIEVHLTDAMGPLIDPKMVFFEQTKQLKVKRISDIRCSVYVDDLPEILLDSDFPDATSRILFDPDSHHIEQLLTVVKSWDEIQITLENLWN